MQEENPQAFVKAYLVKVWKMRSLGRQESTSLIHYWTCTYAWYGNIVCAIKKLPGKKLN